MDQWLWAQSMWIFVLYINAHQRAHAINEHWTPDTQNCPSIDISQPLSSPLQGLCKGPRMEQSRGQKWRMYKAQSRWAFSLQSFCHWRTRDLSAAEINSKPSTWYHLLRSVSYSVASWFQEALSPWRGCWCILTRIDIDSGYDFSSLSAVPLWGLTNYLIYWYQLLYNISWDQQTNFMSKKWQGTHEHVTPWFSCTLHCIETTACITVEQPLLPQLRGWQLERFGSLAFKTQNTLNKRLLYWRCIPRKPE